TGEPLGGALQRDDRWVSPASKVTSLEIDPDSGLTSDEGLWHRTRGSPRPAAAEFEARRPNRLAASVVDLTRGRASQPGMRPLAIVPGEVERQLLLESREAVGNQDQPSRALGFERPHASLDHRQASMLVERSEAELNAPTSTPPPESLRN